MDTWIKKISGVVDWLKQRKFYAALGGIVIMVWLGLPSSWVFAGIILAAIFLKASINRIENEK